MSTEITITSTTIDINVTESPITIEAPSGAYPLPTSVFSVFSRTGNVVAAEGDYTLTQLAGVTITSPVSGQALVYNGTSWVNNTETYVGTVTSVSALTLGTTGTDLTSSVVNSTTTPVITLNVPTASASNRGALSSADWSIFNAKQPALSGTGFVKISGTTISYDNSTYYLASNPTAYIPLTALSSIATGLTYTNTTGVFSTTAGYGIPTTASQTTWDAAYNDKINSAAVTGTTTKTLTLNQQDGGTITASWTDDNTDAVTSVFGRTGAVVAVNGDYTTSLVTEGTNLYYTDVRARASNSFVAGSGAYNSTTGVITIPTDNSQIANSAAYITLTSLSVTTPLSYNNTTGAFTISQATTSTNGYLTSTDWNTFNNKEAAITAGTITQYYRGDKTFQILDTSAVPEATNLYYTQARFDTAFSNKTTTNLTEGINLYYTDTRARAAITGTSPISVTTGVVAMSQANTTTNGYISFTDWNTFNGKQTALNGTGFVKISGTTISYDNSTYLTTISGISAGGELSGTYANPTLVNSAVIGKVLTGVNITGGTVVDTDSILTAFGKVQNQINGLIGGSIYQGTWNANTNTPTLTSSVGTSGYYYIVSVAGTTNLNGIADWQVGDWVIYQGSEWEKVDNTDSVVSVNGFTGAVSLSTSNINEGSNLYFTNARAIASSLTAYTSGAGVITSADTILTAIQKLNGNTSAIVSGVSSVYGRTGAVVANTGDYTTSQVTEGTNLYFTDTRARAAISLTTTGTSGAATYVSGVLNIPNYGSGLTGYVPYTGATQDVDLGVFKLNAQSLHAKGTGGLGHLGLKHQSLSATASANEASLFADSNGDLSWVNGNVYLSKFITSSNTANRSYTFPNATGIIALTSDISYPVTSVFGRTGVVIATNGDYTTTQVTEGTNLYYTDTRARTSISTTATGLTYTSGTGVLSLTASYVIPTTTSATEWDSAYTNRITSATSPLSIAANVISIAQATTSVSGYLSSTDWTTFNNKGSGTVTSVTGTAPVVSSGGTTPAISMAAATTSVNGYLTSTDWTTFNNKQSTITNPVTGTGTTNYLSKFTGASAIGNSLIFDNGANVLIGSTTNDFGILGITTSNAVGFTSALGIGFRTNVAEGDSVGISFKTKISLSGTIFENARIAAISESVTSSAYGALAFYTMNATVLTEKMRIVPSGNVGIGTSTPSDKLHLYNNTAATSTTLLIENNVNNQNSQINFKSIYGGSTAKSFLIGSNISVAAGSWEVYDATAAAARMVIASDGTIQQYAGTNQATGGSYNTFGNLYVASTSAQGINIGGSISIGGKYNGAGNYATFARIQGKKENSSSGQTGGYLAFEVCTDLTNNNTERMRIASNGAVTITSSIASEVLLNVQNTSSTGNGLVIGAGSTSSHFVLKVENYNGTLDLFQVKGDGTVKINQLTSNGTVATQSSNGTLYVSSDANLKIEDGYIENGLEKVLALKPRYFYWKDKEAFSADRQLGFYAQEVNAISEETANTPADGCGWGIYDRGLVALLTSAIQELSQQNQDLKSRLNKAGL